jgi:SRSO17 transposase
VTYANKEMRWKSAKQEREIDEETYKVWTKTLPVSKWGEVRLVITEKVTDEDEENPTMYLATSKIDAPSAHIIHSYSSRWRIETFFEDSKQELEHGLKEAIYKMFSWMRDQSDRDLDGLMKEIDHPLLYSEGIL